MPVAPPAATRHCPNHLAGLHSSLPCLPGLSCRPCRRSSRCRARSATCWPPCSAGRVRPTCWQSGWTPLTRRRRGWWLSATAASPSRSTWPHGPQPRRCVLGIEFVRLLAVAVLRQGYSHCSLQLSSILPSPAHLARLLSSCSSLACSSFLPCPPACPPAGGQGAADPAGRIPRGRRPAGGPAGGRPRRRLCRGGRGRRHADSAHGGGAAGDGRRHLQRSG